MIKFTHVTTIIDKKIAILDDVNFYLHQGEFAFLTGPSGAGKTTILRHIFMDELPTEGQIFVCGFQSYEMTKEQLPFLRRRLGIVFQDFKLLLDRNVYNNIAIGLRIVGESERAIKKKVLKVLAEVGLSHKIYDSPRYLSLGEQQRLSIARAIINDPYVLLADEPTGNLDEKTGREIVELLRRINANGTSVIMATHDVHLIKRMPYRVLRIENGKLVSK